MDGLELADLTAAIHVHLGSGARVDHGLCELELELGLGVGHQSDEHWTLDCGSGLCALDTGLWEWALYTGHWTLGLGQKWLRCTS